MDYIIYIYGDMQIFADMFAALSALFNPISGTTNAFIDESGVERGVGTAVALASIFALMTNVVSYMSVGKFEPHKATYGLAVYLVLWIPTVETVYVADLATSAPSSSWVAIDDVPLGVATIGHALSNISRTLNASLQNDLSSGTVGGVAFSSVALKGHSGLTNTGFLSPLLAILSLREIGYVRDRRIDTNMYFYAKYCIGRSRGISGYPGINWREMYTTTDPLDYLFDTSKVANLAAKRVDNNDNVTIMNCHDLADELNGDSTLVGSVRNYVQSGPALNTAKFAGLIKNSNQSLLDGSTVTNSGNVGNVFNDELDKVVGTLGFAQELQIQNWLKVRASMLEHASSLSDTTLNSYSMVMSQNIETARMEAAVKGENFLKWSFSAMTGLMFVFYALFPLIGVVMVAKGAKGIEFLGSYILFGLWIYSWQTISIIINYWSTSNYVHYLNLIQNYSGLSLDKVELYVAAAQDAVTVGSNLMASVPLITYAVLTGSMFAMTQLSSVATPKGDVGRSVDNQVPQIGSNAPNVEMKSQLSQTVGGIAHGTPNSALPALQGFGIQGVVSSANGVSSQYNGMQTASKEVGSAIQKLSNYMQSNAYSENSNGLRSVMSSDGSTISKSFASQVASSLGMNLSENDTADFARLIGAKLDPKPGTMAQTQSEMDAFLKQHGANTTDSASVDSAVLNQVATQSSNLISNGQMSDETEQSLVSEANSASTAYKEAEQYQKTESAQQAHNQSLAYSRGGTGENMWQQFVASMPQHTGSAHDFAAYRNQLIQSAANEIGVNPSQISGLIDRASENAKSYAQANNQAIGTSTGVSEFIASMKTIGETMNSLVNNPIAGLDSNVAQEVMRNAYNNMVSDVYGTPQDSANPLKYTDGNGNQQFKSGKDVIDGVNSGMTTFTAPANDSSAATTQRELKKPWSNSQQISDVGDYANALISRFTGDSGRTLPTPTDGKGVNQLLDQTRTALLENLVGRGSGIIEELKSGNMSEQQRALKQSELMGIHQTAQRLGSIDPSASNSQEALDKLKMMDKFSQNASDSSKVAGEAYNTQGAVRDHQEHVDANTNHSGLAWDAIWGKTGFDFTSANEARGVYELFDSNPQLADQLVVQSLNKGHELRRPAGQSKENWANERNSGLERYQELKAQVGGEKAFMQTMYEVGGAGGGAGYFAIGASAAGNVVGAGIDTFGGRNLKGAGDIARTAGTAAGVTAMAGNMVNVSGKHGGENLAVEMMANELTQQLQAGNTKQVLAMLGEEKVGEYKTGYFSHREGDYLGKPDNSLVSQDKSGNFIVDKNQLSQLYKDSGDQLYGQHVRFLNHLESK
ncbi:conjugal transfer protein TraG N-terminal domain-containing protein [Vibrio penaeicida]|uniref:TraG N-terminal Proteobacteria domain-containing protein n=1 Tax=Vibrio penaeicida TaxID=104609 RepID=A0AAV5NK85_9VIBR|nr:conjugal transfer protein TraG N-terminal domain-containing protein [Vibrio penaeicida]RTZ23018.1 hypothetical protein EKN09_11080 [Vibrio penaeicida]GLQ71051.1 hypothetical protein GCM10007932_04110 [Vibrio penaeicida]